MGKKERVEKPSTADGGSKKKSKRVKNELTQQCAKCSKVTDNGSFDDRRRFYCDRCVAQADLVKLDCVGAGGAPDTFCIQASALHSLLEHYNNCVQLEIAVSGDKHSRKRSRGSSAPPPPPVSSSNPQPEAAGSDRGKPDKPQRSRALGMAVLDGTNPTRLYLPCEHTKTDCVGIFIPKKNVEAPAGRQLPSTASEDEPLSFPDSESDAGAPLELGPVKRDESLDQQLPQHLDDHPERIGTSDFFRVPFCEDVHREKLRMRRRSGYSVYLAKYIQRRNHREVTEAWRRLSAEERAPFEKEAQGLNACEGRRVAQRHAVVAVPPLPQLKGGFPHPGGYYLNGFPFLFSCAAETMPGSHSYVDPRLLFGNHVCGAVVDVTTQMALPRRMDGCIRVEDGGSYIFQPFGKLRAGLPAAEERGEEEADDKDGDSKQDNVTKKTDPNAEVWQRGDRVFSAASRGVLGLLDGQTYFAGLSAATRATFEMAAEYSAQAVADVKERRAAQWESPV
jgi:hypothetical protein